MLDKKLVIACMGGAVVMYVVLYLSHHLHPGHVELHTADLVKNARGPRAPGPAVPDECGIIKWLKENGGRVLEDGVEMAEMEVTLPSGATIIRRGLRASRELAQDEEVVFVPEKMMVMKKNALKSPLKSLFLDKAPWLDNADLSTLYLMYELEQPDSFFKPYFCTLPKTPPQPFFLDEEQMKGFKAAFLRKDDEPAILKALQNEKNWKEAVEIQKKEFNERYEQSLVRVQKEFPEVFPADTYTKEEFFYAYGILGSRSFAWVLPEDPEGVYSMMPFADMPNRDRSSKFQQMSSLIGHESRGHEQEGSIGMALVTSTPVGKGRELFANYGEDCSEHFVMNYGFLPHYCQAELLGLAEIDTVLDGKKL